MQARRINKLFMSTLTIMIVLTIVLSGCGTIKSTTVATQTYPDISQPHPPIRTGEINTGTEVQEVSQSVNSSGERLPSLSRATRWMVLL